MKLLVSVLLLCTLGCSKNINAGSSSTLQNTNEQITAAVSSEEYQMKWEVLKGCWETVNYKGYSYLGPFEPSQKGNYSTIYESKMGSLVTHKFEQVNVLAFSIFIRDSKSSYESKTFYLHKDLSIYSNSDGENIASSSGKYYIDENFPRYQSRFISYHETDMETLVFTVKGEDTNGVSTSFELKKIDCKNE